MDSITILAQYDGYIAGPGINGGVIFLFIFVIAGLLMFMIGLLTADGDAIGLGLAIIFFFGAIGVGCYSVGNPKYQSYSIYEVLLNEDIPFQEFYDRYEVIEQKGLIYIIKDRTE